MKILILDTYYAPFLWDYYKRFPEAKKGTYFKNKKRIIGRLFGTSDFYSKNLKLLGIEADEIILNDKIIQTTWAKEHDFVRLFDWADGIHIPFTKIGFHSNWLEEILEKQIVDYKPDVIYCQNLAVPGVGFLNKIKRILPVFVVGQIASPAVFDEKYYTAYDLILTALPYFVNEFKKIGKKSELFKIGFEETVLKNLKPKQEKYDVSFVGGFSRHHNNDVVLSAVTDFWGYGVKKVNYSPEILKKYHGEAWGVDMYNILRSSKITLNRHINMAKNHASNMRLYEATGVGTMLITDYKSDLHKLFVLGKEVETYKTKEELHKKIQYYLSHDKEREKIAKAGQKRTLKEHTYKKRITQLTEILNRYL